MRVCNVFSYFFIWVPFLYFKLFYYLLFLFYYPVLLFNPYNESCVYILE